MEEIKELPIKLDVLEVPFKISAGPGAGKTTWLVNHVQNVIKNSNKLGRTKKVACITYTRIGADTVNKKVKIETGTDRLDIGTIHSFLYRNVIKPFVFLIEKDENGDDLFNTAELNGHIEHLPNYARISSWIKSIGFKYSYLSKQDKDSDGISNLDKTIRLLSDSDWFLKEDDLTIGLRRPNYSDLRFPTSKLFEYKLSCWNKGLMHHEDVLYFTHYIFKTNSKIIELISNKFPYLFLDEFQDTNPLQTWIVKQLADKGTIIGVIGDPAQSIFEFAGAKRKDFIDFTLPGLKLFKKTDNFRSTIQIINFLKSLRDDINQKPGDEAILGEAVVVLVGEAPKAIEYIKDLGDEDFAVLCRYNKNVNKLRYSLKKVSGGNLISKLYSEDSDHKRPQFIHSLLKAYDFYKNEEYKDAIREVKKHLRGANIEGLEKRRLVINILDYLNNNSESDIITIYNYWQSVLKDKSINLVKIGKAKDVHNSKFIDFLPFLTKQTKIESKIRTIHQAKGDEFNNVLLCLFDKTDKNGLIKKKLENIISDYILNSKSNIKLDNEIGEETRLVYVACSRARRNLIINVSHISDEHEAMMNKVGLEIIKIGNT
jgi:DNA helicase-2/ATP-dependent DNA helicase PcrA